MDWLRSVHFYRKVPSDLTEATMTGGTISLLSSLVMAYLFCSNFLAYLSAATTTSIVLDSSDEKTSAFAKKHQKLNEAINDRHALRRCGDCELRQGNMRDEKHWDFLTKARDGGHMKVFVNNFNDVMGRRSTETRDGPTLDDRICAIFAALQPGARMLTLNRMLALGPSRDEANQ